MAVDLVRVAATALGFGSARDLCLKTLKVSYYYEAYHIGRESTTDVDIMLLWTAIQLSSSGLSGGTDHRKVPTPIRTRTTSISRKCLTTPFRPFLSGSISLPVLLCTLSELAALSARQMTGLLFMTASDLMLA